jgi:hypothetical protein
MRQFRSQPCHVEDSRNEIRPDLAHGDTFLLKWIDDNDESTGCTRRDINAPNYSVKIPHISLTTHPPTIPNQLTRHPRMPGKHSTHTHRIVKKKSRVHFSPETHGPSITPTAGFTPLPPTRSAHRLPSTRLNPLLASTQQPAIAYDLTLSPSYAISGRHHLTSRELAEPATNPALASFTVVSPFLPWSITVHGSHGYVTVADVLNGVYSALRLGVSGNEFSKLLAPDAQARAADAYRRRYRRVTDSRAYSEEKAKGLTRVDFLMEYTRWMGLVSTTNGAGMWELRVA